MAHLLVLRQAKSAIYGENLIYSTHEDIERNIDDREYPVSSFREGYNKPYSSQWTMLDYRVKEDVLPYFVRDLGGKVLNPYPNTIRLIDVVRPKKLKKSDSASVGRLFLIIRWFFKWINRKRTSSALLFVTGLVTFQLWLWALIPLILLNPVKPVRIAEGERNSFSQYFHSHYIFGQLGDPTERFSDGYYQEDVL